jgi:hypothetical protein
MHDGGANRRTHDTPEANGDPNRQVDLTGGCESSSPRDSYGDDRRQRRGMSSMTVETQPNEEWDQDDSATDSESPGEDTGCQSDEN